MFISQVLIVTVGKSCLSITSAANGASNVIVFPSTAVTVLYSGDPAPSSKTTSPTSKPVAFLAL